MKKDIKYRIVGIIGLILLLILAVWQERNRFFPSKNKSGLQQELPHEKNHNHSDPGQHKHGVKSAKLKSADKSLKLSGKLINGKREVTYIAFQYGFQPDPLVVKAGEQIKLFLKSKDVNHGMMIPELDFNTEISSGEEKVVEFKAPNKLGKYPIYCSVYCGSGHGGMKGTLVVLPDDGGKGYEK